ncbi:hypothetical protein K435DRAFT_802159 [Dendrothele bispora CBS 962.96]|uniref:Uncharacterized protein n=1 Tax=Dendrothele bispora (strain CBS 962.96) TaxID=1314807 RepID=A0A4S8LLS9_DENBC|nr:hypothetical protein K435DRAFT_802159 [Dendrothele bispora CBS 962.96]
MTANVTFIIDSQDLRGVVTAPNDNATVFNPLTFSRLTPNNTLKSTQYFFTKALCCSSMSAMKWSITLKLMYVYKFTGSSVLFFGYALGEVSKNFTVDGSLVQPNTLSQYVLTGGQFPSSPFQSRISWVQQMGIDYALVTATKTSNLEDKTIFVDDDDAEITWSGWTREANSTYYVFGVNNPDLPAGNHTLTATIHGAEGSISAYIDYITYKPIFGTLIDKPDFSDSDPTPIPNPNPNTSGSHDSVAVKVGATIGSLLLITILIASLWFFKRRQKREKRLRGIHEVMSDYVVEPFSMPISEANFRMALGRKGTGENIRSIITTQDVLTHRPVSVPMQPSDSAFNIIPPSSAMPTSELPAAMAARMRGVEVQIELMSREMQQHIVAPPTYQSEWNS